MKKISMWQYPRCTCSLKVLFRFMMMLKFSTNFSLPRMYLKCTQQFGYFSGIPKMYPDLFQFYPISGTTSNVPERYILGIPQVHLGYTWNVPNFAMGCFTELKWALTIGWMERIGIGSKLSFLSLNIIFQGWLHEFTFTHNDGKTFFRNVNGRLDPFSDFSLKLLGEIWQSPTEAQSAHVASEGQWLVSMTGLVFSSKFTRYVD